MQSATPALRGVVERARAGDGEAFGLIYEAFASRIHSHAFRLLGNRQDADDVTQETFLRAMRSLSQLENEDRIGPWLYAIGSHLCLDLHRRRRIIGWLRLGKECEEIADPRAEIAAVMADGELVRCALAKLPAKDALCLTLRDVEGFTCQEIEEITGFSQSAIWSRLSRARTKFAKVYSTLCSEAAGKSEVKLSEVLDVDPAPSLMRR